MTEPLHESRPGSRARVILLVLALPTFAAAAPVRDVRPTGPTVLGSREG